MAQTRYPRRLKYLKIRLYFLRTICPQTYLLPSFHKFAAIQQRFFQSCRNFKARWISTIRVLVDIACKKVDERTLSYSLLRKLDSNWLHSVNSAPYNTIYNHRHGVIVRSVDGDRQQLSKIVSRWQEDTQVGPIIRASQSVSWIIGMRPFRDSFVSVRKRGVIHGAERETRRDHLMLKYVNGVRFEFSYAVGGLEMNCCNTLYYGARMHVFYGR